MQIFERGPHCPVSIFRCFFIEFIFVAGISPFFGSISVVHVICVCVWSVSICACVCPHGINHESDMNAVRIYERDGCVHRASAFFCPDPYASSLCLRCAVGVGTSHCFSSQLTHLNRCPLQKVISRQQRSCRDYKMPSQKRTTTRFPSIPSAGATCPPKLASPQQASALFDAHSIIPK